MRDFINIVNKLLVEARAPEDRAGRPTRTADRTRGPMDDPFALQPEQPIARAAGRQGQAPAAGRAGGLPGSATRSAADVRMRSGLPPEAGAMMGDFLSRQHDADEISDEEAMRRAGINPAHAHGAAVPEPTIPEPRNPENLPIVVRQELMAHGRDFPDNWEPKWTMVKHLPGYLKNAIRAMGRQVFQQFTDTPIEDIQVMASPMLNSDTDMQRMAGFIAQNGIRDDEATMDFQRSIPGYQADVALYRMADYEFLVVNDFAGRYIYGWPGGRGVHLAAPADRLRLR